MTTKRSVVLSLTVSAFVAASPVSAQENDWLRFGPGNTTGAINTDYDRQFIKDWESNPPKGFATISAANIAPTKAAIKRYEEIVKAGGWQPLPDVKQLEGKSLVVAQTHPAVAVVRARLAASGDLTEASSSSTYFDRGPETAVKRFQATNGLTPTGIVDERTSLAMNVPADARLKQLKANLTRLSEFAGGSFRIPCHNSFR